MQEIFVHDNSSWQFFDNLEDIKKFKRSVTRCSDNSSDHHHYPVWVYKYTGEKVEDSDGRRRYFGIPEGYVYSETISADCT